MQLFCAECAASLEDARTIRRQLKKRLSELRLSQELIDDLLLVTSEIATNAVVHSQPPPTKLEMEVLIVGSEIVLKLTDDGVPFADFDNHVQSMKPQDDPAYGLDSPLKGSGRGLALVRDLADRVRYEPGDPNQFWFYRSLAKRRPTLLLVEDDKVLAETLALGLSKNYHILMSASVEDALSELHESDIDLVVADYHLADGTGHTLAQRIEQDANRLPLPVILLTGDYNPDIQRKMLEIGVEATLQKPVSQATLEEMVRLALRRSQRRRASHFRHLGVVASKLLAEKLPDQLGRFCLIHQSKAADLGSGDALLHLTADNKERLILMDAMGHGLGANSASIALAAAMRAVHSINSHDGVSDFLQRLSHVLFTDPALGKLIATVLVIDLNEDGTLDIASAGHPPPVVIGRESGWQVSVGGPLLGFDVNRPYESVCFRLNEGERLFCFSDGLDPKDLSAGEATPEWLSAALHETYPLPLSACVPPLVAAIESRLGPQPEDDWTFLILENKND